MSNIFEMSNFGKLGIEVEQRNGFIELKKTSYANKIPRKAGLTECNPTKLHMDPKEQLKKEEGGKEVDVTQFKSLVGGLRHLVHTRPDIAYSIGVVSRYMEQPTALHLNTAMKILCYIKGTDYGLVYSRKGGNNMLTGYSNSDLACHIDDRKSTRGMVFYLNESLITWVSQKKRCVTLSSCEAEFIGATAAAAAACQCIWLRNVLSEITN